jgi:hypothetical protein
MLAAREVFRLGFQLRERGKPGTLCATHNSPAVKITFVKGTAMHTEKTSKAEARRKTRKEYRAPILQKREKLSEITRGFDHRVS